MTAQPAHRFCTAPMMDWSDTWCRRFFRLLTKRALLFTEMVVGEAAIHGDRAKLLGFDESERPIALQLGGSDPAVLAKAAAIGADWGYDEINLNVGCPSDRVQAGRFGACLMLEPQTVADNLAAMAGVSRAPITVKCRIGVDDQDPHEALPAFLDAIAAAGCRRVYIHARKAWLKGLSPKENRTIPALDHALVRAMKQAYPDLEIILNGGLRHVAHTQAEAEGLDGVMLGRAAYETPHVLAEVDRRVFGDPHPAPTRGAVAQGLKALADDAMAQGRTAHAVTRHALGLFHGAPGARAWRRVLSQEGPRARHASALIDQALAAMAPRAVPFDTPEARQAG